MSKTRQLPRPGRSRGSRTNWPRRTGDAKTAIPDHGVICGDFEDVSRPPSWISSPRNRLPSGVSTSVIADETRGSRGRRGSRRAGGGRSPGREPCAAEEDARQRNRPRTQSQSLPRGSFRLDHRANSSHRGRHGRGQDRSRSGNLVPLTPWQRHHDVSLARPRDGRGLASRRTIENPNREPSGPGAAAGARSPRGDERGRDEVARESRFAARAEFRGHRVAGSDLPSAQGNPGLGARGGRSPQPPKQPARTNWDRRHADRGPRARAVDGSSLAGLASRRSPGAGDGNRRHRCSRAGGPAIPKTPRSWPSGCWHARVSRAGKGTGRQREKPLPETVVAPRALVVADAPRATWRNGVFISAASASERRAGRGRPELARRGGQDRAHQPDGPAGPGADRARAWRADRAWLGPWASAATPPAWHGPPGRSAWRGRRRARLRVYREALEIAGRPDPTPRHGASSSTTTRTCGVTSCPARRRPRRSSASCSSTRAGPSRHGPTPCPRTRSPCWRRAVFFHEQGGPEAETMLRESSMRLRGIGSPERDARLGQSSTPRPPRPMPCFPSGKTPSKQYRLAIEQTSDLTIKRSWWFNLASVAQHLDDETQRTAALEAALDAPVERRHQPPCARVPARGRAIWPAAIERERRPTETHPRTKDTPSRPEGRISHGGNPREPVPTHRGPGQSLRGPARR